MLNVDLTKSLLANRRKFSDRVVQTGQFPDALTAFD